MSGKEKGRKDGKHKEMMGIVSGMMEAAYDWKIGGTWRTTLPTDNFFLLTLMNKKNNSIETKPNEAMMNKKHGVRECGRRNDTME